MGTFNYSITVGDTNGGEPQHLEALVDTGAFFTTIPGQTLHELGVRPTERESFLLADGRRVEMDLGEARVGLDGKEVTTIVAFGEEGGPILLGAYTLEGLRLLVDPYNRRLIPNNMLTL